MASNTLETRRKRDSYEIRRNDEIILYFRKDVFPRWFVRLIWVTSGSAVTATITYLIKVFAD